MFCQIHLSLFIQIQINGKFQKETEVKSSIAKWFLYKYKVLVSYINCTALNIVYIVSLFYCKQMSNY